jgi:hypothetical protein
LIEDKIVYAGSLPTTLAQKRMRGCHRLDTPIERFDEMIQRTATFSRLHHHCGYPGEHVFNAMVEFGD